MGSLGQEVGQLNPNRYNAWWLPIAPSLTLALFTNDVEQEFSEVRYPHATPKQQQEYAICRMHISPLVAIMSECAGELGSSVGKENSTHVDRTEGSVRYDAPLDGCAASLRPTGRSYGRSHHLPTWVLRLLVLLQPGATLAL